MTRKNAKTVTITAALPYANGPVHIGHLAGVYLPADVYARHLRSQGRDVAFISGSDEHGVPISILAQQQGISPQKIIDRYHHLIRESLEMFDISFDHYDRTSNPKHSLNAQDFFVTLRDKGLLKKKTSEQLYDPKTKTFLADRYVEGTCPKCLNPEAYGDQCEQCGRSLSPLELLRPVSKLSSATPIRKETEHWYLPLEDYRPFLKRLLQKQKDRLKPTVYRQVTSWLESPLPLRAISRDLSWGIPVTDEPSGKVLYVWFEAPIAYITATQIWAEKTGKNWEDYWKGDDTEIIHFIGKDNIVFHSIVFPAILKAYGQGFRPADNVPANEFLNLEGQKISTSKRRAVWLHEYLKDFPGQQDSLRYTLLSIMPESKDSDFTWKDFQTKHNSELVSILGNFINRVYVLCQKYGAGTVPSPHEISSEDETVKHRLNTLASEISEHLETFHFRYAMQACMSMARLGNKYLTDRAPWKSIKENPQRATTDLYVSAQVIGYLSVWLALFLPKTAKKIQKMFGVSSQESVASWGMIPPKRILDPRAGLLFEKIEDPAIEKQLEKSQRITTPINTLENKTENAPPQKETISFEQFQALDLKTGIILEATKIKNTENLLQIRVDLGSEQRVIVSGLAKHYAPETLKGKKICVVTNLAARKIKGVVSQGMILTSEDATREKVTLIEPDATPGSPVN